MSVKTIVLEVPGEEFPHFNLTRGDPTTNVLNDLTVRVRPDLLAFTVDPKVGDGNTVFLHPDDLRDAIAIRLGGEKRHQELALELVPRQKVPQATGVPISSCRGIRKLLPK